MRKMRSVYLMKMNHRALWMLIALVLATLLGISPIAADEMRIPITLPIHGYLAFVESDYTLYLLDTYTGEYRVLAQSDQPTVDRWFNKPVFSSQGDYLAYSNGAYGIGVTDISTNREQIYAAFPGREGSSDPIGWSNDGNNIWNLNHSYISRNPPITKSWLDSLTLSDGSSTNLLNFEQYQIYTDLPFPIGVSRFRFDAIPHLARNPVYDAWIALQIRGHNPDMIIHNEDTGEDDEAQVLLTFLWDYQTNQTISLDDLFSDPLSEMPLVWSPDGNKLLVYPESESSEQQIGIVSFQKEGKNWSIKAGETATIKEISYHWLGASNLLLVNGTDQQTQDLIYYIIEIADGIVRYREFFRLPKTLFPLIGDEDWHITASDEEKQALACLFGHVPDGSTCDNQSG